MCQFNSVAITAAQNTQETPLRFDHAYMHTRAHLSGGTGGLATRLFAEIVRLAPGSIPNDDIPPTLDQVAGHTIAHDAQPCHRQRYRVSRLNINGVHGVTTMYQEPGRQPARFAPPNC